MGGFRPICGENVQTQDTITSYKVVGTHQVLLNRLTRFAHALAGRSQGEERRLDLDLPFYYTLERAESSRSSATARSAEEIDAHSERIDGMTRGKKGLKK